MKSRVDLKNADVGKNELKVHWPRMQVLMLHAEDPENAKLWVTKINEAVKPLHEKHLQRQVSKKSLKKMAS